MTQIPHSMALILLVLVSIGTSSWAWMMGSTPAKSSPRTPSLQLNLMHDHGEDAMSRRSFSAALVAAASTALLSRPSQAAQASTPSNVGGKIQFGDESIMSPKAHGTSEQPVQDGLLYGVSQSLADKICNYNRHFAEMGGYFRSTNFEDKVLASTGPLTFYDSVTGKPLFVAPIGRSAEEFLKESEVHGWPSFRDQEVVWDNVRVLRSSGETVSSDGTHLGHNLPDFSGNRYCINLVSIAGRPTPRV